MSLSQLSAAVLARLDAVCLQFESDLRSGRSTDIETVVREHSDLDPESLRGELLAIQNELRPPPASTDRNAVFEPGVQLGPYRIEALLGYGGMGRVFRGLDTRLSRPVAIKVLADDFTNRNDRVERFQRESRLIAAIRHPNIVMLHDVGTHRGHPYTVMELLEGETLRQRMRRSPLTPTEIRVIGWQVAAALGASHERGVIHRDLKPENLFLTAPTNRTSSSGAAVLVKLLDFGLSNAMDSEVAGSQDPTASGVVMGTVGYMAPEQARGEKVSYAADLFGLGCVLHECFYGQAPFARRTIAESLVAVLHSPPACDPELAANDPELAALIQRCLEKDPLARPASAAELACGLQSTSATASHSAIFAKESLSRSSTGDCLSPARLSRRCVMAAVAGAAAMASGGVAYHFLTTSHSPPPIDSIAVLPLRVRDGASGRPIGTRELSEEEQIAAMLVNQLAKQPRLKVVPYRPIDLTPQQYSQVAKQLGVSGLVLVDIAGDGAQRHIHLQLVDGKSERLVWGETFPFRPDVKLVDQRGHAAVLAEQIGLQIRSLQRTGETDDGQAFSCLIRGHARLDPDSEAGTEEALRCFQNARTVDPQLLEAHVGYALTALSLANFTEPEASKQYVLEARDAIEQALALRPTAPTALLAAGMIAWQNDREYGEAFRTLLQVEQALPNNWQVQHEMALLSAAMGNFSDGLKHAERAVSLNPLSLTLQISLTRLRWFSGQRVMADVGAKALLTEFPDSPKVKGLAIDLAEDEQQFAFAAALAGSSDASSSPNAYFALRAETLSQFPYGPYGPVANLAILKARQNQLSDADLATINQSRPPRWAYLLAAHPVFRSYRQSAIVREVLPHEVPLL